MAPGRLPRVLTHRGREWGDLLGPWGGAFVILWPRESQEGAPGGIGSVRDLGSIFHKAGEFYGRCGFAPLRLDAPADLVSWPVPPLKTKTTAAALVQ